jgi:hypothetical protein
VEAAGDHEVKHEVKVAFEVDHDPFSETAQPEDAAALHLRQRWIDRAEQKGTGETDTDERLPNDARLEGDEISKDVGQLGHGRSLATGRESDNQLSLSRSRII